ncbi:putative Venom allergen [Daphnia magna]|uniref:Uncharacterized protein n=2 Tax=Daphnia magna TaxID=35525 RepID=A0ABR0AK25_9CRUS|nr:hypothetical protein OUZ56_014534 [Daphnia magna]KZS12570.1 putative Venom allergen [Daphnia magna]
MRSSSLIGTVLIAVMVAPRLNVLQAEKTLHLNRRQVLLPYYYLRSHWPITSGMVFRQQSTSSRSNPVFCIPDKTLAKYPVKRPKLADFLDLRVTDEEKHLILELHNQLRQRVASGKENRGSPGPQPSAISIPNLKWSQELADAAWEWAKHLAQHHKFEHGPEGTPYGQNLGFSILYGTSSRTWDWVINYEWSYGVNHMNCRWVEEFRDSWTPNNKELMEHYKNHTQFAKPIGRYTQMVWAETTHVGCAAIGYSFHPGQPVICSELSGLVRLLYVCNYSPKGNIVGQPVYKVSSNNCTSRHP